MNRVALPAALLLAGACTPSGLDREAVSASAPATTTGNPVVNTDALLNLARSSDIVVVATVRSLGVAPASWSGFAAAYQTVTYAVGQVLKGGPLDPTITVRHTVVHGAPSADPTKPGLNPALFAPGAKLILALKRNGDLLVCAHEVSGTAPWSAELEQALSAGLN